MERSRIEPDVVVVGAGAAGLFAALAVARRHPHWRVLVLEASPKPGIKILASGGERCNVTNAVVTEADYNTSSRPFVRRVLRSFTVADTRALFAELGVELVEEPGGKLFPRSQRATTVRRALLDECERCGVEIRCAARVEGIARTTDGSFRIGARGPDVWTSPRVLLTPGGRSYPRTGSDGSGYGLARALGHTIVPLAPALVPLVLSSNLHDGLAGIAHDVELTLLAPGARPLRIRGPLLWTHAGISGPAVLDISRHWERAHIDGRTTRLLVNALPEHDFSSVETLMLDAARRVPGATASSALARYLPRAIALACARWAAVDPTCTLNQLQRDERRRLVHALTEMELPVSASRGWDHAEVTSGGVPLGEVDPTTLQSRVCPGLYLAGEILDVDGRLGGFNFQWAWSSAWLAAAGLARPE